MDDDKPVVIDTTMRARIDAMTTAELYKYVWDLYRKLKQEGKM
jgi:hypothetical protein